MNTIFAFTVGWSVIAIVALIAGDQEWLDVAMICTAVSSMVFLAVVEIKDFIRDEFNKRDFRE